MITAGVLDLRHQFGLQETRTSDPAETVGVLTSDCRGPLAYAPHARAGAWFQACPSAGRHKINGRRLRQGIGVRAFNGCPYEPLHHLPMSADVQQSAPRFPKPQGWPEGSVSVAEICALSDWVGQQAPDARGFAEHTHRIVMGVIDPIAKDWQARPTISNSVGRTGFPGHCPPGDSKAEARSANAVLIIVWGARHSASAASVGWRRTPARRNCSMSNSVATRTRCSRSGSWSLFGRSCLRVVKVRCICARGPMAA